MLVASCFPLNMRHGTNCIQNSGDRDERADGIHYRAARDLLILAQVGVHAGKRCDDLLLLAVLQLHVRLLPDTAHLGKPLFLRLVVARNQHFGDATRDVRILLEDEALQINDVLLRVKQRGERYLSLGEDDLTRTVQIVRDFHHTGLERVVSTPRRHLSLGIHDTAAVGATNDAWKRNGPVRPLGLHEFGEPVSVDLLKLPEEPYEVEQVSAKARSWTEKNDG